MALDFFAGCVGGCAGVLVGHPFDTIKVRLQTQDFKNPLYKGTVHCFRTTLYKEGVWGLYRGMSSPMAGVAVVNAIVFGIYGNLQRRLSNSDTLSSHFLAGACAGFAQSFICCPMELAKTRLQLQQNSSRYSSPLDCLRQVTKVEGLRGVFKGQTITIAREIPGLGFYFLSYEAMTRSSDPNAAPIPTWYMLLAGGLAGTISWVSTYPIDVIKSRLQADGADGVHKYKGAADCFMKSVKSEGYSCLSRGLCSTIVRSFPTNAATFAVVTWIFRLFRGDKHIDEASTYHLASGFDPVALDNNWLAPNTFEIQMPKPKERLSYAGSLLKWRRVLHKDSFMLLYNCSTHDANKTNNSGQKCETGSERCESCGQECTDDSTVCKSCAVHRDTTDNSSDIGISKNLFSNTFPRSPS